MVPFWASGRESHCLPSRRIQEKVKVYALFTPTTFLRTDLIGRPLGFPPDIAEDIEAYNLFT